jgi:hypothetical protein
MQHAGVQPTTVGIVVPTGYSFNLDGTAIYMTMASLFVADAMGNPLSIGEQLSHQVLDGDKPFDERTMVDDTTEDASAGDREPAKAGH